MKKRFLLCNLAASCALLLNPLYATEFGIYGRAHLSVDQLDNGNDSGLNLASNASRFGIRGSHQVQDNLKVLLQIESLIRLDEGSGDWASRNSFLGLQGDFGLVRAGFFDTPLKNVRSRTDLFGDQVGDARNIVRGGGVDLDRRFRNGLHYQTPAMQNITLDLHYSSNDRTGSTTDNKDDAYSGSVTFDNKALMVMLAYERRNRLDNPALSGIRAGASYRLTEQWRLTAFWQQSESFSGGDRSAYGVGAAYRINDAYSVKGQLYHAGSADADDSGATMVSLGVDRRFGRNLTLYGAAAMTNNQQNASFNVSAGGGHGKSLTIEPGQDPWALSVGVIYNFSANFGL
ncbi:porin [Alkalimonas collagenimarina]|uniref:Porin n=1 Tax=Alkalimonas collagenimarina TaxID=400390 RepID=A0ABT9GXQ2_9GAMM|nr:porin [Alkalimonas collagenimarina]MDP4535798.1 porin [Alkalimonas collagenimarina]